MPRTARLQVRRRNARRQHDEKIDRQTLARIEHVLNAFLAEHIRELVRIDHHRAGPVRHDRARELRHRDHRALDVKMSVDQARREISAFEIDHFARFVVPKSDHAAIVDRDIRGMNFAAEDVDQLRVLEEQLRRRLRRGRLLVYAPVASRKNLLRHCVLSRCFCRTR